MLFEPMAERKQNRLKALAPTPDRYPRTERGPDSCQMSSAPRSNSLNPSLWENINLIYVLKSTSGLLFPPVGVIGAIIAQRTCQGRAFPLPEKKRLPTGRFPVGLEGAGDLDKPAHGVYPPATRAMLP